MNGKNLLLAAAVIGVVRHVRPVRRIQNLVSSIRSRGQANVTLARVDKLPLDIQIMLAFDDEDEYDFDIVATDFVGIAKKAALVPPRKSCLKKAGAPSRNLNVTFEGQKKAWVPKSLLKKRAEAKQKAMEAAKKEAETPATPAGVAAGKAEALCTMSLDSSIDASSPPNDECITSAENPPKAVPAIKRVQVLTRSSSVDSAESIGPIRTSPAPHDDSPRDTDDDTPVGTVSNSIQMHRNSLMNILQGLGILQYVKHMLCPTYKTKFPMCNTNDTEGCVDFSNSLFEQHTSHMHLVDIDSEISKIVEYEMVDECHKGDPKNLEDYDSYCINNN